MSAVWGWSKVDSSPDGGAPCQRSLHAAAVLNDSIYIFGGMCVCMCRVCVRLFVCLHALSMRVTVVYVHVKR